MFRIEPTAELLVFASIMGAVLLFAVMSNALLIYCVVRVKKMRTITNLFICNISVSDILLAGFIMPQKLHDIFHKGYFHEGEVLCKLVNFSPIFVISNAVYTLVCMSYERHNTIMDGADSRMKFRTLALLLVFIWLFAFIISLPTLLEYSVQTIETVEHLLVFDRIEDRITVHLVCATEMSYRYALLNAVFVFVISYAIPVSLMTKNYLAVAIYVWRKGKTVTDTTLSDVSGPNGRYPASLHLFKHRVKMMKLLVMVALIFAVSWLPFFILYLYAKATGNDASEKADGFANLLLITLATFSSAYNIILYLIFNPSLRKLMFRALKCAIKEDTTQRGFNEQTRPTSLTPHDNVNVAAASAYVGTSKIFSVTSMQRLR